MIFKTLGTKNNPAILFFHAMGVTGDSSMPVAQNLQEKYFCIMPTSSVYCKGQKYISKQDEIKKINNFLQSQGINEIQLVVASSIGADLALAFIVQNHEKIKHVFFDGGQFAQISKPLRRIMTPFLYLAIKSLYWSKGKTLKKILWCDDESIKPYFIQAGKNLKYGNLHRQLGDSVENKPFPPLEQNVQEKIIWEFGSIEDHLKDRDNVMKAYPHGQYPIFDNFNHMQYQIRNSKGFSQMLEHIIQYNEMPSLPFLKK